MKSVTLSASGIKFSGNFNTTVIKVISPESDSKIVLASLPQVEISLGSETAKSLGIEKDSPVTIKPVSGSEDGSFTLEVGEKKQAASTAAPNRGSSPARLMSLSNSLR